MKKPLRRSFLLLALALLGIHLFAPSTTFSEENDFKAILTEHTHMIPKDEEPRGEAVFKLNVGGDRLHYKLMVYNLKDILMAHLHLGVTDHIGTPVVWLYPSAPPPKLIPGNIKGVLAEGDISQENLIGPLRGKSISDLVAQMRAGNMYVNVHTKRHPESEIIGKVSPVN